MKTKFFTLLSLSVLMLVMVVGLVSAVTVSEWNLTSDGSAINVNADLNAGTFSSNGVTFNSFDATDGAVAEDWSTATSVDTSKYFEVTIAPQTDYTLTISDVNFDYSASIIGPAIFDLEYSKQTGFASPTSIVTETDVASTSFQSSTNSGLSIVVNSGETLTLRWFGYDFSASTNEFMIKNLVIEGTVELEEPDFCLWEDGWNLGGVSDNPGELKIKDIEVTNNGVSSTRFGDDENWFLFEEIEVEIEVENKGDEDIDDISIEWGLYNEESEEWTIEVDEAEELNLRDGDEETISISFKIDDDMDEDLEDLVDGTYRLYVRATGVVDNAGDDETCISDYNEISMIIEKDFVILDNINYLETVSCGTVLELTADVWNIGSDDQEDVYVIVYSDPLGINQRVDIGDIDAFEDEKLNVLLSIPEDAEEKGYDLSLMVFDEYDDMFENDFDEDDSKFIKRITIEGNCIHEPKVEISADLESEARAGKELVVRATIVNTGTETSTFEISLANHLTWASLESVVPMSITLEAGEAEDVLITLKVNSDVSGNQNFEIVVTEGTNVLSQQTAVMIEESRGLASITGGLISESNWPIWTIGAVNVILVFIIILVALKISRK